MKKQPLVRSGWGCLTGLDFVRRLPQSQFPQSHQRLLAEKILQRLVGLLGCLDSSSFEPVDERFGRDIHHHDFVGLLDHPVRHGLSNTDARDLLDLVV